MESASNIFHKRRQVYVSITYVCPMFFSSLDNFQRNIKNIIKLVLYIMQLPLIFYFLAINNILNSQF
jgi:hypothetical protein